MSFSLKPWYRRCSCSSERSSRRRRRNEEKELGLPTAIPPRIMALTEPIDIFPNDEGIRVQSCLSARFDAKIKSSLLPGEALVQGRDAYQKVNKVIIDSKGNKYQCTGVLPATWRARGDISAVFNNFYITTSALPKGAAVLLAETDENVEAAKKRDGEVYLPVVVENPTAAQLAAQRDQQRRERAAQLLELDTPDNNQTQATGSSGQPPSSG